MNLSAFPNSSRRFCVSAALCCIGLAALPCAALENSAVDVRAEGWMNYSYIFKSSDTTGGQDFNSRALQSYGVRVYMNARLSDHLQAVAGLGAIATNMLPKGVSSNGGYAPFVTSPYIAEANFTTSILDQESSKLTLCGGFFPFDYNPDSKDLGLYLMRGPVYPGIVNSGPAPNILGLRLHHEFGGFQQDLLLKSETELAPYFDFSPAYVVGYEHSAFRMGAGVNLYHFFPIHSRVTDGKYVPETDNLYPLASGQTIAFHGTKLMANAALDLKAFIGGNEMGPEDLKVYGEAALMGLDNDSLHKKIYGDYLHRMPMMAGFNFPTFKLLDYFSVEVEWYGARFSDDLVGYNAGYGAKQSPLPVVVPVTDSSGQGMIGPDGNPIFKNIARDNWKWSLQGCKTFQKHYRVRLKAANDHLRPGVYKGEDDSRLPGVESIMGSPQDWYGALELAYFF